MLSRFLPNVISSSSINKPKIRLCWDNNDDQILKKDNPNEHEYMLFVSIVNLELYDMRERITSSFLI
jgi:hypothetical protein